MSTVDTMFSRDLWVFDLFTYKCIIVLPRKLQSELLAKGVHMTDDLVRITLRVPADVVTEFQEILDSVGFGRRFTPMYSIALSLGMRALSRQLAPLKYPESKYVTHNDLQNYDELRTMLLESTRTKKK